MFFYKEIDGSISREYKIKNIVECKETEKAMIEVVETEEFGNALFLDNQLQMTERDEYIYHEMLIHPMMSLFTEPIDICVLGGGDGCAVRELLKWSSTQSIDLYDWDKELLALFKHKLSYWNSQSLSNAKVNIYIQDVLALAPSKKYDAIVVDLVDPDYNDPDSKTLWTSLIPKLSSLLSDNGTIVLNVGGLYAWNSSNVEWILMLLANAFSEKTTHELLAYKVFVPSFAREWCFFLLKPIGSTPYLSAFDNVPSIRYFDRVAWEQATTWTKDASPMIPKRAVNLNGYLPPL